MAYDSSDTLSALGRFTSEMAINDKVKMIQLTNKAAEKILKKHSFTLQEFLNDFEFWGGHYHTVIQAYEVAAYDLFAWLGY